MERPRIRRASLLWAALALPALTADAIGLNEPRAFWPQLAGLAVLAAAVAVARRHPVAAFGLTAVLGLADAPALFSVSYGPALGVLALLLGLRADRVLPAAVLFAAVGCAGTAKVALVGVDPAAQWVVLTGTLLSGCVFPWLGGRYWRQSRELARAGWTRAARIEEEQRIAEERARLRERARIAQDMHDSLGHELSLIALRAGASRSPAASPNSTGPPRPTCARPPPTPRTGCTASSASCARTTIRCRWPRRARASSNSSPARPSRGCRCAGNRREPVRPYSRARSPNAPCTGSCARR